MLLRKPPRTLVNPRLRLFQMTAHLSNGTTNGDSSGASFRGVSLADLPKSNVFTSSLPADSEFPTPTDSFKALRTELGPRMVRGALYTYIRPEETKEPELLGVSRRAMKDIGLCEGEEQTDDFKQLVAGNKIMWDPASGEGIYPWAQCYGGICEEEHELYVNNPNDEQGGNCTHRVPVISAAIIDRV